MSSSESRILRNPKTLMLGLVSLILLAVLACGGAAATPAIPTQDPQATATRAQVPTAEPTAMAPPEAATISRPLVIVSNLEPDHLDWMDGNPGAGTEHYRNSFSEPLTQRIPGSSELRSLAEESWEAVGGDPSHW